MTGVRVVELGVWVAGPAAAGILADWGADVVKIEPPAGDPARLFRQMLGGDLPSNPVFELDNRSKRSIAIDLTREEGRRVAERLIDRADVFVTNIRPSALERLGFDPDSLRRRHPRLVYAIITGYGMTGPEADRPGFDIAAYWARAGVAASLTPPGRDLPFQRGGMGDHTAGMSAAGAIAAALFNRERTGEGDVVSTSLLRQGAYTMGFDVNVALMWGLPIRIGTRDSAPSPTLNNYTAGDGRRFWVVGLEADRHWPPLARVAGRPEWLTDERFTTASSRRRHSDVLIAMLDEIFATRQLAEWAEVFATEADFFWAPVQTIEELISDPQFLASGGLVEVPDESGTLTMVATPVDFRDHPASPRFRAPAIGEHSAAVLSELGYGTDEVEEMARAGVVVGTLSQDPNP